MTAHLCSGREKPSVVVPITEPIDRGSRGFLGCLKAVPRIEPTTFMNGVWLDAQKSAAQGRANRGAPMLEVGTSGTGETPSFASSEPNSPIDSPPL